MAGFQLPMAGFQLPILRVESPQDRGKSPHSLTEDSQLWEHGPRPWDPHFEILKTEIMRTDRLRPSIWNLANWTYVWEPTACIRAASPRRASNPEIDLLQIESTRTDRMHPPRLASTRLKSSNRSFAILNQDNRPYAMLMYNSYWHLPQKSAPPRLDALPPDVRREDDLSRSDISDISNTAGQGSRPL